MRFLLGGLLLLVSCATLKHDQTVCPEYRDLRCATEVTCSFDQSRGCRVCSCSPASDGVAVPPPESTIPVQ
jgi:hypothetical protein